MFDCIIIGAGPAGLTAAIYLCRKKLKILVLTQDIGGQIKDGPLMENYPGFEKISGPAWIEKVKLQAEKLGVQIKTSEAVTKIIPLQPNFVLETEGKEKFRAKTVLIASGKSPLKLNVPGEENFRAKGISHCVTCDGPLFQGKTVAVIGGGNSAIIAALELKKFASKVYIINLGQNLIGEEVRIDEVRNSPEIEVISEAKTTEILGSKLVEKIKIKDLKSGQEKEIEVQGIFIEIGWQPSTGFLAGTVALSSQKEIIIDENNATNIKGIFAAGDATNIIQKQAIIAAGEGAKAALAVSEYLSKLT